MNIPPALKESLETLRAIDFKTLERREEFGRDYSFREAADILHEIFEDLERVTSNSESLRISTSVEQRVTSLATRAVGLVQRIKDFVLVGNEQNARPQFEGINNEAKALYQDDLDLLPQLIERASILKLNPDEVSGKITRALDTIKEIDKIKLEAEKARSGVDIAIKEVRDSLGSEGALISANNFQNQAGEHQRLATYWFRAACAALLLTVLLVIFLFHWSETLVPSLSIVSAGNDYPKIIQIAIFKIVLLSIAYLVISLSVKNFKINTHLYILNKHRQHALQVYPLMAKATSDPNQANTIVAQAAVAIFEPGTTGYLDADENPNPINLTEVINKVVDKV